MTWARFLLLNTSDGKRGGHITVNYLVMKIMVIGMLVLSSFDEEASMPRVITV